MNEPRQDITGHTSRAPESAGEVQAPQLVAVETSGRDVAILLLAFAGASVDALSYLALGRVFTANMTGNTILFTLALIQRSGPSLLRSGVAVGGYLAGSLVAAALLSRGLAPRATPRPGLARIAAFLRGRVRPPSGSQPSGSQYPASGASAPPGASASPARPGVPGSRAAGPPRPGSRRVTLGPPRPGSRRVTLGLWLELVILAVLALAWRLAGPEPSGRDLYPLIALAAMAMGAQGAAVQRLHVRGVSTTYITGMLTALTSDVVVWLRNVEEGAPPLPEDLGPRLPALTWAAYAAGAVIAGIVVQRWHVAVLLLPSASILAALARLYRALAAPR